jgi:malate dehydrogenase (oxaloacetate-decarboxylating)
MKLAAAYALANHIPENELNEENIIPSALDRSVASEIAEAVKKSAIESGNVR